MQAAVQSSKDAQEGGRMPSEHEQRRQAYVDKTNAELNDLSQQGVYVSGTAFSPILILKGEAGAAELSGGETLSGDDGAALRAALGALGYDPQDWLVLPCAQLADGGPAPALLRQTLMALDPSTVVCCDEAAAMVLREALADDLAALPTLEEAMLTAGIVVHVLGMRVLNLGGFEAALTDAHQKQVMWARLKQVPPLGEPF